MVRFTRINKHGVYLIKKGQKWVKQKTSTIDSKKLKRWRESSKPKKEKE